MFLQIGENIASRYFAIQKVLVTLGHPRKKKSKISGNSCCLEFKGRTLLITDENKGKYIFQLAKACKQTISKSS